MEFALFGFDIYTSKVDDKGIDFAVRSPAQIFHEMQVKALRGPGYVFMQKSNFAPSASLHLTLVLLREGQAPTVFLIPSTEWLRPDRPEFLADRNYGPGKSSKPEYGIKVAVKHMADLAEYALEKRVVDLA